MNTCEVILECQHRLPKRVKPSWKPADSHEYFYCLYHGNQRIRAIHRTEWRLACQECRYGRWCGQSRALAMQRAKRHVQSLTGRGHAVFVAEDTITKDHKGIILAPGVRWPTRFNVTPVEDALPIYVAADTITVTANTSDDPPPF